MLWHSKIPVPQAERPATYCMWRNAPAEYFGSKESLCAAVAKSLFGDLGAPLARLRDDVGDDASRRAGADLPPGGLRPCGAWRRRGGPPLRERARGSKLGAGDGRVCRLRRGDGMEGLRRRNACAGRTGGPGAGGRAFGPQGGRDFSLCPSLHFRPKIW